MEMIEGQNYLVGNEDNNCKCKLTKIIEYNASGMPSDYIFTPLEGETSIFNHETMKPSFPIPHGLLFNIVMKKLENNGEKVQI